MLRFVQGIHKAFRSNQAYAPCQKAAHDQDEFDTRVGDSTSLQRRSYGGVASVPLSQPLADRYLGSEHGEDQHGAHSSPNNNAESQSLPNSFVPAALLGVGYAAFNAAHAYCGGRGPGRNKDRSKYCPVTRYKEFQSSSVIASTLANLVTGTSSGVNTRLSVLPKQPANRAAAACLESHDDSSMRSTTEEDNALCQKEFEKAQEEVNMLADRLSNIDKDHLAADHFLAMSAWKRKDFVSAAGLWHRTVDKFATGIAAHRLGIIYEKGHGVPQDYQQASTYYNMAISHQCSRAMYRQAMLQMNGLVEGDMDSMDLIKQSAELNYCKAQTFLGTVHFHNGDQEMALKYYKKAAAQNDEEACYYLGICYEVGHGVSADDVKAVEYYSKAAKEGHADAQYNLALFYEEGGGGLDVNEEQCVYWLKKSAAQGNKNAKEKLKELSHWTIAPSASLPSVSKYLPGTLSDLAQHDMLRVYSDSSLARRRDQPNHPIIEQKKSLSRASSSSSIAGTPKFYVPSDDDETELSFEEWSDEGLSSASSSSLRLANQHDKFSVDFTLENTSYDPSVFNRNQSWRSLSGSSLYRPDHEGPQITFA